MVISALFGFLLDNGESLDTLGENFDLSGAAFHGHWRLCEFLIERGADVNHADRETGRLNMAKAQHIPDGWPAVIPRIVVAEPKALVAFVQSVFGATGRFTQERPSELRIGESIIMISGSTERDPMPAFLYVYVEDTDLCYRRAIDLAATPIEEPRDLPYGDRRAMIRDPWGNTWQIATHSGYFAP